LIWTLLFGGVITEQFPILSRLARIYLPTPDTSTPSERLFSDAGNLLTAKRIRLNPELFNRLMFLKKNSLFVKSIHPLPENSKYVNLDN
jgi:hypothetical protein